MVFQDALAALNPVYSVGEQIGEAIQVHHPEISKRDLHDRVVGLLDLVGIPNPKERYGNYPHEFSGGMRQRVMIAMSISNDPTVLIADEPTTALDVTIQAQVLELMKGLSQEFRTATLLVTHDLGVVAGFCQRVAVMYAGHIVEYTNTKTLFATPAHPYTQALLGAVPRPNAKRGERLEAIGGQPPNLINVPPGCPFAPRCRKAQPRCRQELPPLETVGPGQRAACFYPY